MAEIEFGILFLAIALFVVGLIGIIAPVIPSLPVIWAGILLYGFLTGFETVSVALIAITGAMAVIGTLVDFVAQVLGAKMYGASWIGMVGAVIGSIAGFVVANIIGLVVGAIIGTFFAEFLRHRERIAAARAAWGTLIGFLFGIVVKVGLSIAMIVLFFMAVF